jgi:hypothetical protein
MAAEVVRIGARFHAPLCSLCENGYIGTFGVYCIAYHEHINDEAAAASDCPEWEEA